jgi:hypothetical protein
VAPRHCQRPQSSSETRFIRVYGDIPLNTGYYTFFYIKNGETKSPPAPL